MLQHETTVIEPHQRTPCPPALGIGEDGGVLERISAYAEAAQGAFSENTARAVRSDLQVFLLWANFTKHDAQLPIAPEVVAAFIDDAAEARTLEQRKPATIARYVASLNHLHRAAGLPAPGGFETVRLALKRIRRAHGTRQDQAYPLRRTLIDQMLMYMDRIEDISHLRGAALVSVGYDGLMRRSELSALNVDDIETAEDGTGTAIIRHSKTDQEGEGAIAFLSATTMRRVNAWIDAAGIAGSGAMFKPMGNASKNERLSGDEIGRVIKRLARSALWGQVSKKSLQQVSGHSLRVGAAQDMRAAGIDNGSIMQAGRWVSERMVARYTERLGARFGAAAKLAEMQGR